MAYCRQLARTHSINSPCTPDAVRVQRFLRPFESKLYQTAGLPFSAQDSTNISLP